MILVWGLPGDTALARVYAALQRLGREVVLVDQRAILDTEVELRIDATVAGQLRIREQVLALEEVSAIYLRPYETCRLPSILRAGQGSPAWQHAHAVEELLFTWVELTPALVVNRPSAMAANGSKPYQASWIQACGFAIPDTLMTTDPEAVLAFWERHGTVIYKSVSGVRSIVARLTPGHRARLANIVWCPTQFQQYVPGTDYRVHVVGAEVFASKIVSEGDDYRYAGRQGFSTSMTPSQLPEEIGERCRTMAGVMGLPVAGIDLRCTPDGVWYCFEVNPSPGFTYFQDATNQPIDEAIARLLAGQEGIQQPNKQPIPTSREQLSRYA